MKTKKEEIVKDKNTLINSARLSHEYNCVNIRKYNYIQNKYAYKTHTNKLTQIHTSYLAIYKQKPFTYKYTQNMATIEYTNTDRNTKKFNQRHKCIQGNICFGM